ncbi:hypothetical protein NDU88_005269 [Pleurodeles waltl]|uniref:Uncharacterized protein n=1 Tax=Pleurodeles waltl TaxID=8319 RepID=A0AAV7M9G8_PLEWA|nr:hypothetical protein NDU88_005269 [Pleurodeles waltl]
MHTDGPPRRPPLLRCSASKYPRPHLTADPRHGQAHPQSPPDLPCGERTSASQHCRGPPRPFLSGLAPRPRHLCWAQQLIRTPFEASDGLNLSSSCLCSEWHFGKPATLGVACRILSGSWGCRWSFTTVRPSCGSASSAPLQRRYS